jgi:hypothetical protein
MIEGILTASFSFVLEIISLAVWGGKFMLLDVDDTYALFQ